MGSVVIDMSMSLDGYIAAPKDNPEQGLGEDGMRLREWAFDDPSVLERVFGDYLAETGAVIIGRRSYDNSIEAWGGKGPPSAGSPDRERACKSPGGGRRQAHRS